MEEHSSSIQRRVVGMWPPATVAVPGERRLVVEPGEGHSFHVVESSRVELEELSRHVAMSPAMATTGRWA